MKLLLLALTCWIQDPGAAAEPEPDLVILHFNDFHGQIQPRHVVRLPGRPPVEMGGLSTMAYQVERRRSDHGERLWVTNGGDWFQGTPEGNEDRGMGVMEGFNRLQLTASVLGNHEYDYGERHLIELLATATHPILGANVMERGSTKLRPYARPYLIKTIRPRSAPADAEPARIALVGFVTSDTPQVSTGPFGDAVFADEAETLAALWPELERQADHVVLLTHCGFAEDQELARKFPQVAVILGGHSHTSLLRPAIEGQTVIVQSGSKGTALSEVRLSVRGDPPRLDLVGFDFIELETEDGADPDVDEFVKDRFGALAARWDQPLGEIAGAVDVRRQAGSTPAGNYVAQLMRDVVKADVGLTNKGGIRTTLRPGPITRRQVFEFLPFDNTVALLELTGAQLRDVLAQGLVRGRRPLELAGASYTYGVIGEDRRLLEVAVGGAPLELGRVYRVATNSFLAAGGDGCDVLASARQLTETTQFLRDLMVDSLSVSGEITLVDEERIRIRPQ